MDTAATEPIDVSEFPDSADAQWQQGNVVEVAIADLSDSGDGVGRWERRVVFVPDTVPGDRVAVRLVRVKPQYAHGKLQQILSPSSHRVRPGCIVADTCGGGQWQPLEYEKQRAVNRPQVVGRWTTWASRSLVGGRAGTPPRKQSNLSPGRSGNGAGIQAGYYQKGTHRLINLNQCPVQDPRLNPS